MTESRTTLGTGGRLVIPGEIRQAMGLQVGDPLLLVYEGDRLYICTPQQAAAHAQALLAPFLAGQPSLSEALIADRRAEAARE